MDRRLLLDDIFRSNILGNDNVYFQPPPNIQMKYPAIRYELSGINVGHADDRPYRTAKKYTVTIIDRNPDSVLPDLMMALPFCSFDRHYAADNLNHWVFTLFY